MERCKEWDNLFLGRIFQVKEHRTRRTGQKLFRQLDLLTEHGHEVATIVHHNLVTFRAPQNFFRGFIEDGDFKPVQHRTHIRLARAVAVGFDVNISRIIVVTDGRIGIILSRIILSRILPWVLPGGVVPGSPSLPEAGDALVSKISELASCPWTTTGVVLRMTSSS
jgi:hypothetical protein